MRAIVTSLVLMCLAPLAAAQDLAIDCTTKHQLIQGFGTCGMHWTAGAMLGNPDLLKLMVEDLGQSIVRYSIPPNVLPDAVEKAGDISYKNFKFDKGAKAGVEHVVALYKANPQEMKVIASAWSPPGWMKATGKTGGGGALKKECYDHYAMYLAQWVLYFEQEHKVPVYGLSLQNELEFKEPYDSCQYKPAEYHDALEAVGRTFAAAKLKTKLMGPETMTSFVDRNLSFIKPVMDDPKTKDMLSIFISHGYTDGIAASGGKPEENAGLWNKIKDYQREFWMTETSGESASWGGGETKDAKGRARPGALNLAARIHMGLVYGNMNGWVYWCIAGDFAKSKDGRAEAESLTDMGKPTKKYYASKQFYKFIRPGAYRVDCTPDSAELRASAYLHEKNKTLTVVLLNMSDKDAEVTVALKGAPAFGGLEAYRSSEKDDCAKQTDVPVAAGKAKLTVPAKSVVTLYGKAR